MSYNQRIEVLIKDQPGAVRHKLALTVTITKLRKADYGFHVQAKAKVPGKYFSDGRARAISGTGENDFSAEMNLLKELMRHCRYLPFGSRSR